MPNAATTAKILSEDMYRCRYCHSPVVPKKTLGLLTNATGVDLRKKATILATHGAHWLHCATIDHIAPHATSGMTSRENLVTSCYACQFGKGKYSLAELLLVLRPRPTDFRLRGRSWLSTASALSDVQD